MTSKCLTTAHTYDSLLPVKILLVFAKHYHSVLSDHVYFPCVAQVHVPQREACGNCEEILIFPWQCSGNLHSIPQ